MLAWLLAIAAFVALFGYFSKAKADTPYNWTGMYVGGSVGATSAVGNGLGADGHSFGATAGAGIQMGMLYFGGFIDYDHKKLDWAGMPFEVQEITAGGRGGILVTNATLLYALVGHVWLDAKDFDFKTTGLAIGGGVETRVSEHVSIGLEYRQQTFDDLPNGTEHVVKARLNWNIPASMYQALDAPVKGAKKLAP
jgi:opacity protein-like surface antigen